MGSNIGSRYVTGYILQTDSNTLLKKFRMSTEWLFECFKIVRYLFAGISTPELLIAHIFTQFCIVFLQCIEVILFIGFFFQNENLGDNTTVIALLALTGFAGMLFGK